MDITILTAKILGIYSIISGLFLILKGKTVPHLLRDFFDHPAVVYLTGVILIFLSSMYLIQYSLWNNTSNALVTLFAWLVMLKGVAYIFAPQALSKLAIQKNRKMFSVYGLVAIVVGLYLFFLN